jgi:signal peptidase I
MDRIRLRFSLPAAALAGAAGACLVLALAVSPMTVSGASMARSLPDGSVVLVLKAAYGLASPAGGGYLLRWASPTEGELVVFSDPLMGALSIKRCAWLQDGKIGVLGDDSNRSVDSRHYGLLDPGRIVGRVVLVLRRGLG